MISNPFFRIAGEKIQGFGLRLRKLTIILTFDWND